jgi:hypothetical protein
LHDDGFAENCSSGQIAVLKKILGLFWWDSFSELNMKKVGQLSQISIDYLYSLIGPTV